MASPGLTIDIVPLKTVTGKLTSLQKKLADDIDFSLSADATDMATIAAGKAPVDLGGLHTSISANNETYLSKEINVNVFYAAFIEFGTGAYAAAYVASLPATWQEYAIQFKGQKGGGTFADMVRNIGLWLKHKGIDADAYVVARSILIKGIKPQPYLYPAYEEMRPQIIAHVKTILDNLSTK